MKSRGTSKQLADVVEEISDTLSTSLLDQIDDSLSSDTTNSLTFEEFAAENPLYAVLYPNVDQQNRYKRACSRFSATKDTSKLNTYLNDPAVFKDFLLMLSCLQCDSL